MWGSGPGAAWRDGAGQEGGTGGYEGLGEVAGRRGLASGTPAGPALARHLQRPVVFWSTECSGRASRRGDTDAGGTKGARLREPRGRPLSRRLLIRTRRRIPGR